MIRLAWIAAALVAAICLAYTSNSRAAPPVPLRRVAIVVGANEPPPGRPALRFAHDDARQIADVLVRVGRFARGDVQVLLDPHPAELLAALEQMAQAPSPQGGETLLVFYYSGHSDGQAVYPHGEALALTEVRDRLAKASARLRVGILDTCRGGSWTQAKGLTVGPPLDAGDLINVATEGTALVSSSSGLENAHEADAVHGSLFTHHLSAGLLGAADRSGDGNVTLQEAFDYAKERTVRDSAWLASAPQHPSFDLRLRGRQDIVLTVVSGGGSALEIAPAQASLEVIHLESGVVVAEAPPAGRAVRLALPPGRYLVRRVENGHVRAKEITIRPGETAAVAEGQLEAIGNERLALKGPDDAPTTPITAASTPPAKWGYFQLALGASTGPTAAWGSTLFDTRDRTNRLERSFTGLLTVTYGVTDRLTWTGPLPAFAYRFGEAGKFEVIPRGGLTSIGYSSLEGVLGSLDAGLAMRAWTAPNQSVITNMAVDWSFAARTDSGQIKSLRGATIGLGASVGYAWTIRDAVTLHLGAGIYASPRVRDVDPASLPIETPAASIAFGSVQAIGWHALPLVEVPLSRRLSLDAYASWSFDLRGNGVRDRYLGGFTYAF